MKNLVAKILILAIVIAANTCCSHALAKNKNKINIVANTVSEFTIKNQDLPDEITFKIPSEQVLPDGTIIPADSYINFEILKAQRELRWHKGGLILCKLKNYQEHESEKYTDLSDKDLYVVVRKYEPMDKKDAILTGTELVLAQGASFFAPGVDIGYFFIKGAIQRKKHPHWFKAGVHNAYENSICWFYLKGKPIELADGEQVRIKSIKNNKIEKLSKKIDKRNARFERQAEKRISKLDKKELKKAYKNEKKMIHCKVVEDVVNSIEIDRSAIADTND